MAEPLTQARLSSIASRLVARVEAELKDFPNRMENAENVRTLLAAAEIAQRMALVAGQGDGGPYRA